uniref:BLTX271 n=1 Tax=Nephila pilipes TaxID=299642 RepID=A0A076KTR2_NEPPI|nr:BLTX271 [Nephila pilipes]
MQPKWRKKSALYLQILNYLEEYGVIPESRCTFEKVCIKRIEKEKKIRKWLPRKKNLRKSQNLLSSLLEVKRMVELDVYL